MNNAQNPSERDDQPLSEFELELGQQSLGSGPRHVGGVMYQCGYAAGVAEAKKQTHRTTTRYRFFALAASIFASVLLTSHFLSLHGDRNRQMGMDQQPTSLPPANEEIRAQDAWITLLTREHESNQHTTGILRATDAKLIGSRGEMFRVESTPSHSESRGKPLRVGEFTDLL
jgi:hypothetical protein